MIYILQLFLKVKNISGKSHASQVFYLYIDLLEFLMNEKKILLTNIWIKDEVKSKLAQLV